MVTLSSTHAPHRFGVLSAAVWGLIGGTLIGIGWYWPPELWESTTFESGGTVGLWLLGDCAWQCGVAAPLVGDAGEGTERTGT